MWDNMDPYMLPEDTHFVRGSITVGTADLLFYLFGFSCIAYVEWANRFTCLAKSKPAKQEVSRTYSDSSSN